jgi:hypothetical protein
VKIERDTTAEAARQLERAAELIEGLGDVDYEECPRSPYPGGIGAQIRHCIDFFDCFLAGLQTGEIDYRARRRETRLERDRSLAAARLRETSASVVAAAVRWEDRDLRVRSELRGGEAARQEGLRSNLGRELEFLPSHTVHHLALIALLLAAQAIELPADMAGFGVAASTLRHGEETGPS